MGRLINATVGMVLNNGPKMIKLVILCKKDATIEPSEESFNFGDANNYKAIRRKFYMLGWW